MNDHQDLLNAPHPDSGESHDERLRRLESALAAMQDTQLMEQRLLERMSQRLEQPGVLDAGQAIAHAVGAQLSAATSPMAPSNGAMFSAKTWILTDIIQEVRTFFVLYFDYRYRVSWAARIIPTITIVLFILGWVFKSFGADNFVGAFLQHLMNLLLVVITYKTLQREAARYRALFPHLPPI
jgi:hypothetical protein